MERLTSSAPVPAHLRGAVMALGNFDGFHAGHQAVVGHAIARARAEGRPVIVATFDPHPMRLFRPGTPHFRLTTLDQRQALFAAAGADAVLAELGAASGLWTQAVAPVADASGDIISSTRIRTALQAGDCATATRLLTRPFTIEGVVQHGDKLGRTIGFPTANIDMGDYLRPAYGIYAVRGVLPDGRVLDGAANLGIRPMFDPPKLLLEPHFFDFAENLYDQRIAVQLIAYLHAERAYDGLDALMNGIAQDCVDARQILAGQNLAGTPHLA